MSLGPTAHADATVTFLFSFLSLFGSVLVLLSYLVARSKSTPRIANLILHLAASDFFWFLSAGIQSSYWLFSDDQMVPRNACFVLSPLMIFTRMASLAWTCVISFNVLMSVEKRKWLWQGGDQSWMEYQNRYYIAIFVLAAPGTILTLVKQHSSPGSSDLGCSAGYEALGVWYEVFFPEVLPMLMGFLCNVYVFAKVYGKLSKSAYPQSVRKRRKRIMYHYIIVCIVCWVPTVATYMIELIGYHSPIAEILARACLYSSGFLNFLVFGMQDPHLKRSFKLMIYYSGVTNVCMLILPSSSYYYYFQGWRPLKATDVEKNVMFQEETIVSNADLSKDKRSVYRNRKLSKADRMDLYAERPDLDLRTPAEPSAPGAAPVPAKSAMKGTRAAAAASTTATTAAGGVAVTAEDQLADHSGTDSGGEGGDGKRRSSSSSRRPKGEKKVRSREIGETPASREERAASLFQSHVDAGTLIVNSVVPAGGNEVTGRPNTNSRSRSSSFHSGVSDGKYDLLAPLLGADSKEQVSSSYPQPTSSATIWEQDERMREAKASAKKGFTLIPEFLTGGSGSARSKSSQPQQVNPMDVVSAGFRSSSTERLIVHNQTNAPHDIEEGTTASERELLVRTAEERAREMRRQQAALDRRALEDTGSCDDDDLSSSDDESDEEDKELSIPISAL